MKDLPRCVSVALRLRETLQLAGNWQENVALRVALFSFSHPNRVRPGHPSTLLRPANRNQDRP